MAANLQPRGKNNPMKPSQIARVIPEKKGGMTKGQWIKFVDKLNKTDHQTSGFGSRGGSLQDILDKT